MPQFTDCNQRTWTVAFDGLLLKELRDAQGIDLADVVSSVYLQLERDPALLTQALAFLCREQLAAQRLSPAEFSKGLIGRHLDEAFAALWGAAEVFFPQKLWSALSLRLSQERTALEEYARMQPMLLMFNQKEMPPELKEQVWAMLGEVLRTFGLRTSPAAGPSASGPASTPPTSASSSPASSGSTPAA